MSVNCAVTHTLTLVSSFELACTCFNYQCQKIASCQKRQGIALLLEHSQNRPRKNWMCWGSYGRVTSHFYSFFVLNQWVVTFWMLNYVDSKGKWNRASSVMEQDCRRQHSYSALPHKTALEPKEAKVEQLPRHGNVVGDWSPNSHSEFKWALCSLRRLSVPWTVGVCN